MPSANLLHPPPSIPPPTALALSQKAPTFLQKTAASALPWPISLLLSTETPETWTQTENAFLAALRTGDDTTARHLMSRLTRRFGDKSERIIALQGLYNESQASSTAELQKCFDEYEAILRNDPTNMSVRKRRVAILKSMNRPGDAILALTKLCEISPTDAESWAELSELYAEQAEYAKAIFAAEEVLLLCPNSWSAHAHIATLYYLSSTPTSPTASFIPPLTLSLRHFSRALELNTSYLRAFYGLKLVSSKLIPLLSSSTTTAPPSNAAAKRAAAAAAEDEDIAPPKLETVKKLEELATEKLGEIVRNAGKKGKGWGGYDEGEVRAARELLGVEER